MGLVPKNARLKGHQITVKIFPELSILYIEEKEL